MDQLKLLEKIPPSLTDGGIVAYGAVVFAKQRF
jgi:hypothetical protein